MHREDDPVYKAYGAIDPKDKMRKKMIDALNRGTEYADGDQFQTAAFSYRHAMRNADANQTPEEAMAKADAFVRKQLAIAKELLSQGKVEEAYFQFAIGLHVLQDATSCRFRPMLPPRTGATFPPCSGAINGDAKSVDSYCLW